MAVVYSIPYCSFGRSVVELKLVVGYFYAVAGESAVNLRMPIHRGTHDDHQCTTHFSYHLSFFRSSTSFNSIKYVQELSSKRNAARVRTPPMPAWCRHLLRV